jgi:AraC-like DNA-binding protein
MLTQDHLTLKLVRLKAPQQWATKRDGLSFLFPKGGAGKFTSGGVTQRLAPGSVLVWDGGGTGQVSVAGAGEAVFWCFSLSLEHLFPLFTSSEITLLQSLTEGIKGVKLYPAASPVAAECHKLITDVPPQFNLDHRGQLLRVAAAILTHEFKTIQQHRVGYIRVEEHITQVFEQLSADDLLKMSVGELADKFGCSRRHLGRLFHQHFGFSVASLRMEMRLIKAVSLLRDPDAKVINVAEQCGFNHLGLFNTCFRRRFGMAPGQWRKKVSQEGAPTAAILKGGFSCPLHTNGMCPWTAPEPGVTPAHPGVFVPPTASEAPSVSVAPAAPPSKGIAAKCASAILQAPEQPGDGDGEADAMQSYAGDGPEGQSNVQVRL